MMKSVAIIGLALAGSALARIPVHTIPPREINRADNELHNYYSNSNQGNVQINDYKTHDDELWGVGIDVKSEVNNFPHNSGTIIISHDDEADNELHKYFSMPGNQGEIQFNDYTVQRDAVDNELHKYFSMPGNQGEIQFNDYTVKRDATDDELWGVNIGVQSEVNNFPHNSGTIVISHDDEADNQLHNFYTMEGNQGNIQFNDYSKTHDDELIGIQIGVKSEVNNFPHNSGTIVISHDDEADNELHNFYTMEGNQGNIQFNDYSKTHDDEFVARIPEKLTRDELEVLATLLKVATQDKDGNVVVDGVKIGKIPKKAETKKIETPKKTETKNIETPKIPKKFLAL